MFTVLLITKDSASSCSTSQWGTQNELTCGLFQGVVLAGKRQDTFLERIIEGGSKEELTIRLKTHGQSSA